MSKVPRADQCVYDPNRLCECWVRLSNGEICPIGPEAKDLGRPPAFCLGCLSLIDVGEDVCDQCGGSKPWLYFDELPKNKQQEIRDFLEKKEYPH